MVQWNEVQTVGAFLGHNPHKGPGTLQEEILPRGTFKIRSQTRASELDGCVLLCHEKDSTYCHRRIVAEWLEVALGIKVPEMEYAVKKMPNLWDFVETGDKAMDKIAKDETTSIANKGISAVDKVPWEDSGLKATRPIGNMTLKAIHEPSSVVEFAPLILNLYAGGSHDYRYCYVKLINQGQNRSYRTPSRRQEK